MTRIEQLESRLCLSISFQGTSALPVSTSEAAFGDITGDGIVDVVTKGTYDGRCFVYAGLGNFTFASTPFQELVATGGRYLDVADFDHDGNLDIVFAGSNSMRVFRNLGGGTFNDPGTIFAGIRDMQILDFNGDGNLDILFAVDVLWPASYGTPRGYGAGLLLGNGDVTFQPVRRIALPEKQSTISVPAAPRLMAASNSRRIAFGSNVTRSGQPTALVQILDYTHWDAPTVTTFAPFNEPLGGLGYGDINNDGRLDLVAELARYVSEFGESEVHSFLGQPGGTFKRNMNLVLPLGVFDYDPGSDKISMADFDRNGTVDFVVTGLNPLHEEPLPGGFVFDGRGDGTFSYAEGAVSAMTGRQREQDLNGDGRVDLLYDPPLESSSGRVRILLNTSTPGMIGESNKLPRPAMNTIRELLAELVA